MRRSLLGLSVAILLAGCAPSKVHYDRPGATPAVFEQESAECKRWATRSSTMKTGAFSPFSREPGLGTVQSPAGSSPGGDADQYHRAYQECLQMKGWKQVPTPRP